MGTSSMRRGPTLKNFRYVSVKKVQSREPVHPWAMANDNYYLYCCCTNGQHEMHFIFTGVNACTRESVYYANASGRSAVEK